MSLFGGLGRWRNFENTGQWEMFAKSMVKGLSLDQLMILIHSPILGQFVLAQGLFFKLA